MKFINDLGICPECKSKNLAVHWNKSERIHYVEISCQKCGRTSHPRKTLKGAMKAWRKGNVTDNKTKFFISVIKIENGRGYFLSG